MSGWQSQAHVRHYCKYHVVFVPKYRRKSIYGPLRKEIGGILRELCRQQGVELIEGYAMRDHIHMLLMISTLLSISLFLFLWLIFLLNDNTMKNTMLRKSFKMLEMCRLSTATQHPRLPSGL